MGFVLFRGDVFSMGVRYELSQQSWAVRSKPAATGRVHSYLESNSQSLQKTYRGGRSVLAGFQRKSFRPSNKGGIDAESTRKDGLFWVVGFGDSLRGEKGER